MRHHQPRRLRLRRPSLHTHHTHQKNFFFINILHYTLKINRNEKELLNVTDRLAAMLALRYNMFRRNITTSKSDNRVVIGQVGTVHSDGFEIDATLTPSPYIDLRAGYALTLANAMASYRYNKFWTLQLNVDNLFDKRYAKAAENTIQWLL